MSIGISVAHAAHVPERVESMRRLRAQLPPSWPLFIEDRPGKPQEWAERQWRGALSLGTSHCLMLNDDVTLCDGFERVVENIVAERPAHLVNLWNSHPLALEVEKQGMRWLTSPDGCLGNAYLLPSDSLHAFLEWRGTALKPGVLDQLSEDQTLNLFAMAHGYLTWSTVPSPCDHDMTLPSLYGNENNLGRRPTVGPRKGMAGLVWDGDALHTGRIFNGNHWALVRGLKVPLPSRYFELVNDVLK